MQYILRSGRVNVIRVNVTHFQYKLKNINGIKKTINDEL